MLNNQKKGCMYHTRITKHFLENNKENINVPIGKWANIWLGNSPRKNMYGQLRRML